MVGYILIAKFVRKKSLKYQNYLIFDAKIRVFGRKSKKFPAFLKEWFCEGAGADQAQ